MNVCPLSEDWSVNVALRGLFALLLCAALTYGALSLWQYVYRDAARRRQAADRHNEVLARAVARLKDRERELTHHRDALQATEPTAVEEAIRAELGWGRPGECILRLPPEREDRAQHDTHE